MNTVVIVKLVCNSQFRTMADSELFILLLNVYIVEMIVLMEKSTSMNLFGSFAFSFKY